LKMRFELLTAIEGNSGKSRLDWLSLA
jgi:hypothetical protein